MMSYLTTMERGHVASQRQRSDQGLRWRRIDAGRKAATEDDVSNRYFTRGHDDARDQDRSGHRHREAAMTVMTCDAVLRLAAARVDEGDDGFSREVRDIEIAESVQHARE
jgi:hypothetical protein